MVKRLAIVGLALAVLSTAVNGGRYKGEPEDAAPVRALLQHLADYQGQLQRLLEMRASIERRQQELDQERARLQREMEQARADRAKVKAGRMSEEELVAKWHESGRSLRNDRQVKAFKRDVARFNQRIQKYNKLAETLSGFLDERSPQEVNRLVDRIQALRDTLEEALEDGNFVKARYIAEHSELASELGYPDSLCAGSTAC